MTKSELIQKLAENLAPTHPKLPARDIDLAVNHILEGITSALAKRDRAEIRGFGSFEINHRPPRNGRNPKSGEAVLVPAKDVPHFRAGKELRDRVNK